jgi:hypothetical protein
MTESKTKKLRLTRSIILNKTHAEKGSVHEVPNALAQRLVGEGSAEHIDPQDAETSVNRMESPSNRDPETKQVAGAPPKVKAAK